MEQVAAGLDPAASLFSIGDADHSFHVPTTSGHTDAQVLGAMLDATVSWIGAMVRSTLSGCSMNM